MKTCFCERIAQFLLNNSTNYNQVVFNKKIKIIPVVSLLLASPGSKLESQAIASYVPFILELESPQGGVGLFFIFSETSPGVVEIAKARTEFSDGDAIAFTIVSCLVSSSREALMVSC